MLSPGSTIITREFYELYEQIIPEAYQTVWSELGKMIKTMKEERRNLVLETLPEGGEDALLPQVPRFLHIAGSPRGTVRWHHETYFLIFFFPI